MATVDYIFNEYKVTDKEFAEIDEKFGNLCYTAAWDLKRKNFKNNSTDEIEDIVQSLKWHMITAAVYTKRQRYIEALFLSAKTHVDHSFMKMVVKELGELWENRTRHGANKQKFGAWQENILAKIVSEYVPVEQRPDKNFRLNIDKDFSIYCKAIIWNHSKNLGKKITRERNFRSGLVSISNFESLF